METDYLIVGQGLAGSLLAHELLMAGKSFLIIDNPYQSKASDVAAGMVNPVVFRRMTKSWLIDDLYPYLLNAYARLEKLLEVKLFYPLRIKKVLGKDEERLWQKQSAEKGLQSYLEPATDHRTYPFVCAEFGLGTVCESGRVDLKLLVEKMKVYLLEKQWIQFGPFNFDQLVLMDERVSYQGITAGKIIFCEGHAVSQNPFFTDIHFKHTRGELLRLKTEKYKSPFILNKDIFLMPEGNCFYRLGATYDWQNLSPDTTKEASEELRGKLTQIFAGNYQVVGHSAGIRPTTHDRRPVVGLHPEHKQIGIFNGLGSKGAMLGPWFARQLTDFLSGKVRYLHPEASIDRYFRNQK